MLTQQVMLEDIKHLGLIYQKKVNSNGRFNYLFSRNQIAIIQLSWQLN